MTTIEVASDTCDSCGAPAFLYADHPTWPAALAYCAHHGTRYLPGLIKSDAIIDDRRDRVGR